MFRLLGTHVVDAGYKNLPTVSISDPKLHRPWHLADMGIHHVYIQYTAIDDATRVRALKIYRKHLLFITVGLNSTFLRIFR